MYLPIRAHQSQTLKPSIPTARNSPCAFVSAVVPQHTVQSRWAGVKGDGRAVWNPSVQRREDALAPGHIGTDCNGRGGELRQLPGASTVPNIPAYAAGSSFSRSTAHPRAWRRRTKRWVMMFADVADGHGVRYSRDGISALEVMRGDLRRRSPPETLSGDCLPYRKRRRGRNAEPRTTVLDARG